MFERGQVITAADAIGGLRIVAAMPGFPILLFPQPVEYEPRHEFESFWTL